MNTHITHRPALYALFASLALTGAAPLSAQSSAPPADSSQDELVTLPEFSVTTSKQSEYVASESITGTRVATKLRDLPFTVNVITADFLDDFSALEFKEQVAYTSGIVAFESLTQGYAVRGIDANVQMRNGFRRIGLIDKVNVERIEVVKGAAASIYGTVMPGGTVNILTKKPQANEEHRITVAAGTNNLRRAQISSTGPLTEDGKFLYRVDMAGQTSDYDTDYERMKQWTIVPQILWRPNSDTSLLVEYEYLQRDQIGSSNVPLIRHFVPDPYRRNPGDGLEPAYNTPREALVFGGIATELFEFNAAGPNSYQDRSIHTVTATFEHRFGDHVSIRSSANWFKRERKREELSGREYYDPLSNSVASGNGLYWPITEGGASWQTDVLASWRTGAISHKTILTLDYQRQTEQFERWDGALTNVRIVNLATGVAKTRAIPLIYPGAAEAIAALPTAVVGGQTLPILRLSDIGSTFQLGDALTVLDYNTTLGIPVGQPTYDFIHYGDDPSVYNRHIYSEDNSLDLYGAFLSHRATLFENRATIFAGVRYDLVDSHSRNFIKDTDRSRQIDAVSYQIGANVRVIDPITAYVNVARSFVPDFASGIDREGNSFDVPNEVGNSKEIGFKAALFNERLVFTTAYFDIERTNVRRQASYIDENNSRDTFDIINGAETSRGYEFDFNWAVLPQHLQFFGQYGYIDSEIINAVATPSFNGGPTRRTPTNRYSVGVKYSGKTGFLRGFTATAGYRYEGSARGGSPGAQLILPSQITASNPLVNTPMPNGELPVPDQPAGAIITSIPADMVVWVADGRESIYTPSYDLFEIGLSYGWKDASKNRHKIQLNIRNLLDERYIYGSNGQGAGRNFTVTYDLRF